MFAYELAIAVALVNTASLSLTPPSPAQPPLVQLSAQVRLIDQGRMIQLEEGEGWKTLLTVTLLQPLLLDREGLHFVQGAIARFIHPQMAPDGETVLFGVVGGGDMALPWIGGVKRDGQAFCYPFSALFGKWEWSPSGHYLAIHVGVGESGMEELAVVNWNSKKKIGTINPRGSHGPGETCRAVEWVRIKDWDEQRMTVSLESGHGKPEGAPECRWRSSLAGSVVFHERVKQP